MPITETQMTFRAGACIMEDRSGILRQQEGLVGGPFIIWRTAGQYMVSVRYTGKRLAGFSTQPNAMEFCCRAALLINWAEDNPTRGTIFRMIISEIAEEVEPE